MLWTEFSWHNLASFKAALRKAWAKVTGDIELLKRLCQSWEKRRVACIASGGEKVKY